MRGLSLPSVSVITKASTGQIIGATVAIMMLPTASLAAQAERPVAPDIAITNVSVVDVELGRVYANQTVLIASGRIAAIGNAKPNNVRIVDGRGKFLVPGLTDTHSHVRLVAVGALSRADTLDALGALITFGVTGIREAGHVKPAELVAFRRTLETERAVPRLYVSGVVNSEIVGRHGAKDALDLVRQFAAAGVDGIKIRNGLSNEEMAATISEARRLGLPSFGHTYDYRRRTDHDFTLAAAGWGASGVMHVLGIAPAIPEGEPTTGYMSLSPARIWLNIASRWLRTSDASVDSLIQAMVTRGTWLEPTLLTEHYLIDSVYYRNHPHNNLDGLPFDTARSFMPTFNAEQLTQYKLAYARMQNFVRHFHGAGGIVLAGTDDIGPKGAGLHDELRLLVQAGLSPLAALQAATVSAARALGWSNETGAIKAGLSADLLLVSANPLENIANLQKIDGVFVRGRYFDVQELNVLRARAEAQATRTRKRVMGDSTGTSP